MLNWLLVFVPIAAGLHYLRPESHTFIFLAAAIAIVPLAGWMGHATEHIAEKTGEGIGGLLNATFGNAAEMIIAIVAMQRGLHDVVKASLTGSIIGNVLLVMGAAFVAGGLKFKTQTFNVSAARTQSTMLTLAAIAMIVPAAFHYLSGPSGVVMEYNLSLDISVVLLITYALSLVFSLITHKQLFAGHSGEAAHVQDESTKHQGWSMGKSVAVLLGATALIAWISEMLVASVEAAAHTFGMSTIFVGVIVVAIVGNAAEHSTAILVAMKNRMDLSLSIAIGSSIQIALFVAPVLVLLSYVVGPRHMDLVFTPAEVLAIGLSVAVAGQIAGDGESNWLEGVQLLAVYVILGIVFFFLPDTVVPGATH
ncbi:MAG TPA: calcium/proton exchanger [Bryobacteraceae bacterium]|nr:calcium/proton exchanger [Bryobacteraceae bacterium]